MGSAVVIDVGTVLFAGRPMSLDERVEVPPFDSVTFPQPAHVRLDLRRVGRGLAISGTIEASCEACRLALYPRGLRAWQRSRAREHCQLKGNRSFLESS